MNFAMRLIRWLRLNRIRMTVAALLLVVLAAVAAAEWETYYVRDQLAEQAYGWKPHRVPCEQWPTPGEVGQAIDRNADLVSKIEAVNPGIVMVELNTTEKCPGKADIRILYATRTDLDAIRTIVMDDRYLFGVPYRMLNT